MPRINLLPWRDQQRRERKMAFFIALGGSVAVAAIVAFIAYLLLGSMIDAQDRRNDRLRAQIKVLDKQIEEIMRTYGLSMEEAGRAKKEGGLPGNFQAEVLDPFIDDMTQQVSRSLQFYLASGSGRDQPDKILICGGCANIAGVADVVQSRVGISAERGDPLGQMKLSSRARAQAVQRDATALLTACGLALRSFD